MKMNIGIVTTWFERGAAYVSKNYMELLQKEGHTVFIYARGGEEHPTKREAKWNEAYVTRDETHIDSNVSRRKLYSFIQKNNLDILLFNEQKDFRVVVDVKERYPDLKVGAYVDYYTERTIPWFRVYDFLVCNTKRHMQAMQSHPQKYYLPWGTDVTLFSPKDMPREGVTFFHSVGMAPRKGTDVLVDAYIAGKLYERSKLILHTQAPIEFFCRYNKEELEKYGITVIEETVTAPGLYYMGDVYVYPTKLDGLGLTMYEALACGLPVITSDFPPMNETINEDVGRLVKIGDYYCRADGYYFPMVLCDRDDLIRAMDWYIDHPDELQKQKEAARQYAVTHYDLAQKSKMCAEIFEKAHCMERDKALYREIRRYYKQNTSLYQIIRGWRFLWKLNRRMKG